MVSVITGIEFLRNVGEFKARRERYNATQHALNTRAQCTYTVYVLQAAAAESKEVDCRMRDALS